jgi:hypothetical protein
MGILEADDREDLSWAEARVSSRNDKFERNP